MNEPETIDKKRTQLNIWLAEANWSRKDLALKLNVSEATVYNWLSCTNIPEKRWEDLKKLFTNLKQESEPTEPRKRILGANFSEAEVEKIKLAAKGQQLEDFIRALVLKQIKEDLK